MHGIKKLSTFESPIVGWGMARLTLKIDPEHKNKKIGFHPRSLRSFSAIDQDFMRFQRFSYVHGEGVCRALREDASSALTRFACNN